MTTHFPPRTARTLCIETSTYKNQGIHRFILTISWAVDRSNGCHQEGQSLLSPISPFPALPFFRFPSLLQQSFLFSLFLLFGHSSSFPFLSFLIFFLSPFSKSPSSSVATPPFPSSPCLLSLALSLSLRLPSFALALSLSHPLPPPPPPPVLLHHYEDSLFTLRPLGTCNHVQ